MLVKKDIRVPLFDPITCLSNVTDLVNPELAHHHKRVAYIAYSVAAMLGLPKGELNNILLAGMLHDTWRNGAERLARSACSPTAGAQFLQTNRIRDASFTAYNNLQCQLGDLGDGTAAVSTIN